MCPTCQVYADLFNLPSWQAQRFLDYLNRGLLQSDVAYGKALAGERSGDSRI